MSKLFEDLKPVISLVRASQNWDNEDEIQNYIEAEGLLFDMALSNMKLSKIDSIGKLTLKSKKEAFLDIVTDRLSFSTSANHAYLQNRGTKLELHLSAFGEADRRIIRGSISSYSDPVLYYDCDEFSMTEEGGHQSVNFASGERNSKSVLKGVYMRVNRPDSTFFYSNFTSEDMKKFKEKGNDGFAWSSEEGMYKTKCIKHTMARQPLYFRG